MRAQNHQILNFSVTLAGLMVARDKAEIRPLPHPLIAAPLSAALATLPDLIEPAVTPLHRQAFHSIAFAMILGFAIYEVYRWEAATPTQEILRSLALIGGSAYLLHLAGDMLTAQGLPLLRR